MNLSEMFDANELIHQIFELVTLVLFQVEDFKKLMERANVSSLSKAARSFLNKKYLRNKLKSKLSTTLKRSLSNALLKICWRPQNSQGCLSYKTHE